MTKAMVVSHEDLFVERTAARCDACGGALTADIAEPGRSYGLPGQGIYMWARGDDVRFESAPLCPSCASAIGMTALARWEIEEEES
ncbi:MAG: hypothetical protein ACLP1X_13020 [Polyangiaceae bacterium]|jgi:hypothetical protein